MSDEVNEAGNDINHLPLKKDAFLFFPYILVVVIFVLQIVLISDERTVGLQMLIGVSLPIIVMVYLFLGIKHLAQKRSKSSASLIFSIPFLILLVGFPGISTWGKYARDVAYFTRFSLHEREYLDAIKLMKPDDMGARYKVFLWSDRYYGEGTELVYDESDVLNLPETTSSTAWWGKVHGREETYICSHEIYKIKLHFYVVSFNCP